MEKLRAGSPSNSPKDFRNIFYIRAPVDTFRKFNFDAFTHMYC